MQAEAERPEASDMTNPLPHQRWHTSSLIACCPQLLSSLQGHNPCSPTHPLCSPPFGPRAVLQFLSLLGPVAAVGTRQVAIGINEPKLSPLVKCSHLTHLEPGEGAQSRQVWGLYKAPNEGLLAREGGGRHGTLVWSPCCWSCNVSNIVSATVSVIAAAAAMVIVARFHWQFGVFQSNEVDRPTERGKNRFQQRKDEDGNRETGRGMRTECTSRVDWSVEITTLIILDKVALFV